MLYLYGVYFICGVGFTMSLFISELEFKKKAYYQKQLNLVC